MLTRDPGATTLAVRESSILLFTPIIWPDFRLSGRIWLRTHRARGLPEAPLDLTAVKIASSLSPPSLFVLFLLPRSLLSSSGDPKALIDDPRSMLVLQLRNRFCLLLRAPSLPPTNYEREISARLEARERRSLSPRQRGDRAFTTRPRRCRTRDDDAVHANDELPLRNTMPSGARSAFCSAYT